MMSDELDQIVQVLALAESDTEMSEAEKVDLFRGVCDRLLSSMRKERRRAEQAEADAAALRQAIFRARNTGMRLAKPGSEQWHAILVEARDAEAALYQAADRPGAGGALPAELEQFRRRAEQAEADALALLGRLGAAWIENAALRRWLRGGLTIADIDVALAAESALATHDAGAELLTELEAARAFIGWLSEPEGNIYEPLRIEERLAAYHEAVKAAKDRSLS